MPYPIDWTQLSENGARFVNSEINPLSGGSSLLGQSDGTEWDVTAPGFRQSSSIFLKSPLHERGFSDGKIRTLVRRNSADQTISWSGIFFLSDRLGIGTRLDPGLNRYEVSDENGSIKIIKVTNGIKSTLLDTGQNFLVDTIYGIDVQWEYDITMTRTLITVKLGTNVDFSDLTTIGTYSDIEDSFNSPHQFSTSEGFFFQNEASGDLVSYNYDKTTISRFISI